ncbi:condensation domain-containing protein [Nonomuraea sp. NPDC004297]
MPASQKSDINRAGLISLPPGTTIESVQSALRALRLRHEGLRSTYDASEPRNPRIVIHDPQRVSDAEIIGDLVAHDSQINALKMVPFDLQEEVPWRFRIIAEESRAIRLALVYHHIATDAWSMQVLQRDLFSVLSASSAYYASAPYSLIELAMGQRTRTAAAGHQIARRWALHLANEAQVGIVPLYEGTQAPVVQARFMSRQLRAAAQEMASGLGISGASVILAAYACALHKASELSDIPIRLASSNRYQFNWKDFIALNTQWVPLQLKISQRTKFGDLARAAHYGSVRVHSLGGYNVDEIARECKVPVWQLTGLGTRFGFNYISTSMISHRPLYDTSNLDIVRWQQEHTTARRHVYLKVFERGDSWFIDLFGSGVRKEVLATVLHRMHDTLQRGIGAYV